ncbi:MAG: hypothetical protein GVY34_10995 [Alphaproteobacteria bacterium]|jgi:hypothetical protein|nr:hypothetical protein [Alphaproteobacteria bacterium]
MTSVIQKLSHNERDFDRLFIEELAFGEGFLASFLRRIDFGFRSIKVIKHSVFEKFNEDAWGETDIYVEFEDGALLLIENKLSADFQKDQAKRYRARAEIYKRNGTEANTVLIAPLIYLNTVSKTDWDIVCCYSDIAECIDGQDVRSKWKRSLFLEADNRANRVQNLAISNNARKLASKELLKFKKAWREMATESLDWTANPQTGATDEFLYAPHSNPLGLRVWHHPFKGYLSVQNLEKVAGLDIEKLTKTLPEDFSIVKHPKSIYLDAMTPTIDMTADFQTEREHVEEGMRIARQALELVEAAAQGTNSRN